MYHKFTSLFSSRAVCTSHNNKSNSSSAIPIPPPIGFVGFRAGNGGGIDIALPKFVVLPLLLDIVLVRVGGLVGSKGGAGSPGIGTGAGGVRRKLPAERTVLSPGTWVWDKVCEDDDECEEDVLGFRCIGTGI